MKSITKKLTTAILIMATAWTHPAYSGVTTSTAHTLENMDGKMLENMDGKMQMVKPMKTKTGKAKKKGLVQSANTGYSRERHHDRKH